MPPVVIDTADVPAEQRFEYWRTASLTLPMPLEIERVHRGAFRGRRTSYDLAGVTVSRTRSDASVIARRRHAVMRVDPGTLMVSLHLGGRHTVSQDGRTAVSGAGDIVIWDSARPFVAQPHGRFDVATFFLPKAAVGPAVAPMSARTAVPIDSSTGRARLVRVFLQELIEGLERGDVGPDDDAMAEVLVDLVRALHATAPRPRHDPLLAVKRSIEERLGDPQLRPDAVAREHHVSRRQLYRLFEADGAGVADWIRARRLERCARDLRDPAHAHESITTIAVRWGFVNVSHFSRAFRHAYGVAPREYRAR
jgi:AraC-like DNA-binding protein